MGEALTRNSGRIRRVALCALLACWTWALRVMGEDSVSPTAPAPAAQEIDNAACLACHGDPSAIRFVGHAKFEASIHGSFSCTTCHAGVVTIPHDVPLESISQSQIPLTCGQCHEDIKAAYQRSIHGQAVAAGKRHAPVCTLPW